jgi:hypothetical protein
VKHFWNKRNTRYLICYEIIERTHSEEGRIFVTGYLAVWWTMKWFNLFNPHSMIYFVEVAGDAYGEV